MARRPTRSERCKAGKHTPTAALPAPRDETVRRAVCRYCGQPIMRTQATRIWFQAGVMA